MATLKPRTLRALLFIPLLLGAVSAFAQVRLPGAIQISVPKVLDARVGLPRVELPKNVLDLSKAVPAITSQQLPKVDVKAPALSAGVGGSVTKPEASIDVGVPSVGGLIPSINARVNVNTGVSGPVEVGTAGIGSAPGSAPLPETTAAVAAPQQHVAERRLDQLPNCR
jgi:hypothetical protein